MCRTLRALNHIIRHFCSSKVLSTKYVQFVYNDDPSRLRLGCLDPECRGVIDFTNFGGCFPTTMLQFVQSEGLLKSVTRIGANEPIIPFSEVTCKAPIHGMDKIICIGMNYKDHCQEINVKPPEFPMFFSKFSSTIIGPGEAVRIRNAAECVDWEVELVVVIGKKASNVQAREAYNYVFGYTVAQDISARDWQKNKNGGQFLLGKSMDTFCPIGPCIATADEVGDPQKLNIRCSVNGVVKQSSNTEQLVHKIPDAIERLTSVMTLLPGDIILTGTPGGVGMYRDPPEYLQPGHVVESEVEKIGVLTTRVEGFRVCANK